MEGAGCSLFFCKMEGIVGMIWMDGWMDGRWHGLVVFLPSVFCNFFLLSSSLSCTICIVSILSGCLFVIGLIFGFGFGIVVLFSLSLSALHALAHLSVFFTFI